MSGRTLPVLPAFSFRCGCSHVRYLKHKKIEGTSEMLHLGRGALSGVVTAMVVVSAPMDALAQTDALNGANTAWILTSTALVLFMTLPGLALFYGEALRIVRCRSFFRIHSIPKTAMNIDLRPNLCFDS
jgi:hypothetical protein